MNHKDAIEKVKQYYDKTAQMEWLRLENHPFEFVLTTFMMDKYIKKGDTILDIGGGPGRYSLHYAKKGCSVTLIDLSHENILLAKAKASEQNLTLTTHTLNCLALDTLNLGTFDHVLLMGPLYHLLDAQDRIDAVNIALKHLKKGGIIYVSFILVFAGILYDLKYGGNIIRDAQTPGINALIDGVARGEDFTGAAFTTAYFYHQRNILPFMRLFDINILHFFGQEGILAPNEVDLLQRDQEEINLWIDIAKKYLESPELLSYSEHAMVIATTKEII